MKKAEEPGFDPLRRFMNRENIERAPDGLREKVMSAVSVETVPSKNIHTRIRRIAVPAGVVLFLSILIVISVLTINNDKSLFSNLAVKVMALIKLPGIKPGTFTGITIPGVLVYIPAGLFAVVLFDFILGKYFKRK